MRGGVLVTGGSGFLGRAVLLRLFENDERPLIASARNTRSFFPANVKVEQVKELGPDTDWMTCLQGVQVVIHCAARAHVMKDKVADPLAEYRKVNVEGTLSLAKQAAQMGVRRFVFISSIKVNGEHTSPGQPFCADDVPSPQDMYGISKCEAEQGLMTIARETDMEFVIIRPPLIYGPGVKGNFANMVHWVRKGVPLPLGAVNNRRSMVALDNLVDFILLCSDCKRSPRAANEIFLVSDAEVVSTTDLLKRVAKAYGVGTRLIPLPPAWLRLVANMLGKTAAVDRVLGSLEVNGDKVRDLLGWQPPVSMDDQLRKMALYDSVA